MNLEIIKKQETRKQKPETREEKLEERLMEIILRLRKPGKIAKNIDWQTIRFKKISEELVKMKKFSGSKLPLN